MHKYDSDYRRVASLSLDGGNGRAGPLACRRDRALINPPSGRSCRRAVPIADFEHVLAMADNVIAVLKELIAHDLPDIRRADGEPRHQVDNVRREMKAILLAPCPHSAR